MNAARGKRAFAGFVMLMAAVFVCLTAYAAPSLRANAAETGYDGTAIEEDLVAAGIDPTAYKTSETAEPYVVYFAEYCYSYKTTVSPYYGIYFYIYSPGGAELSEKTGANTVNMATEYDTAGEPTGYANLALTVCGHTDDYVLYKLKVTNAGAMYTQAKAYALAHGGERRYDVAGIQLWYAGETAATDYAVSTTYRCTGFAAGCSSATDESTLEITGDELKTLSLEVNSTYYRPEGTHSDGYTKDTLYSVYFSVPNEIIDEYGVMTAVHATWLNAYTAPILVTGNSTIYNYMLDYIGKDIGEYDTSISYGFGTNYTVITMALATESYSCDVAYNFYRANELSMVLDRRITQLDYIFYATGGKADDYTVSSEDLKTWFGTYTFNFGGELVNDRYSAALFEEVDGAFTDITISADDTYTLTSEQYTVEWYNKGLLSVLFGNYSDKDITLYDANAIQAVTLSDMDNALSETAFCNDFYVAESDYGELHSTVMWKPLRRITKRSIFSDTISPIIIPQKLLNLRRRNIYWEAIILIN